MTQKPAPNVAHCLLLMGILALGAAISANAADQPTSTINEGEQYALYNDTDGDLTFTTSEVPVPRCEGDEPSGDPDYFWDYGPLSGTDNGDGSLTIHTDTEGEYQVTVYCSQEFEGEDGPYTEQTESSN
ncbi:MAG TPA: hypothetical protein PLS03_09720 [Terrimicrobiaceae bacterium]|nr:hypothetical protein [Terrimicrobiaceae bacterium]